MSPKCRPFRFLLFAGLAANETALALDPAFELVTNPKFTGQALTSLSADGDVLAVGTPGYRDTADGSPSFAGAVCVFRRGLGGWSQEAVVHATIPVEDDLLGFSVALRGDVLIAGAPHGTTWEPDAGHVYVFRREAGAWGSQQILSPPANPRTDMFGYAVAFDGVRMVATSRGYSDYPGKVFPFRWDGAQWVEEGWLTGQDTVAADGFGHSLVVREGLIIVGAPSHDLPSTDAGAVYVFRRLGEVWLQEAKLTASDAAADDGFGSSILLQGELLLVGAPGRGPTGASYGAVYAFRATGTQWVEEASILSPDPQSGSGFGGPLVFDGSLLLVSAPNADFGGYNVGGGAAYLFDFDGLGWVYREKLKRPRFDRSFATVAAGTKDWVFLTSQPPQPSNNAISTVLGYCVSQGAPCIPTMSGWGIGVLILALMIAAVRILRRVGSTTA